MSLTRAHVNGIQQKVLVGMCAVDDSDQRVKSDQSLWCPFYGKARVGLSRLYSDRHPNSDSDLVCFIFQILE